RRTATRLVPGTGRSRLPYLRGGFRSGNLLSILPTSSTSYLNQQAAHRMGRFGAQPARGLELAALRRSEFALYTIFGALLPRRGRLVAIPFRLRQRTSLAYSCRQASCGH